MKTRIRMTVQTTFGDLPTGTLFTVAGRVYRKIDPVHAPRRKNLQYNAINVAQGTRARFGDKCVVRVVSGGRP